MNNIFLISLLACSLIAGGIFSFAAMGDGNMMEGMDWNSGHHGMMYGDSHHMDGSEHYKDCEDYMNGECDYQDHEHCEYENSDNCETKSNECDNHSEEYCEHNKEE